MIKACGLRSCNVKIHAECRSDPQLKSTMMLSPLMMEQDKTTVSPGTSRDGNFLGDLGKPTMRGIRKCTKCGLLNGTRGTRCKNTTCGMLFKSAEKLKPTGPEAVKLITG